MSDYDYDYDRYEEDMDYLDAQSDTEKVTVTVCSDVDDTDKTPCLSLWHASVTPTNTEDNRYFVIEIPPKKVKVLPK